MVVIGLTGSVGTGKSTVARMFQELGAEVFDADQCVHALLQPGRPTTQRIVQHFGEWVLRPDGAVDRAALGAKVFEDEKERAWLESVIHPQVLESMQATVDRLRKQDCSAVVLEIPLLYEIHAESICDFVVVVSAPQAIRVQRLRDKWGWSEDQIQNRIASQWDLSAKEEKADAVIDNGRSLEWTAEQVKSLWHKHIKK